MSGHVAAFIALPGVGLDDAQAVRQDAEDATEAADRILNRRHYKPEQQKTRDQEGRQP